MVIRMRKRYLVFVLVLLTGILPVRAKKLVRVVALGPMVPVIDLTLPPDRIVDTMIGFWDSYFEQVLPYKPDLIVLPEACDRPAGMNEDWELEKKYYELRGTRFQDHLAAIAREHHTYIVYSAKFAMDDGTFRNASVLLDRDGRVVGRYYKNYPTMGEIDRGIVPGKEPVVLQCDFGTVGFLICFDLNFEELKKEYAKKHPDILVFSSRYQGGIMQKYWALSCQSFFVSACEGIPFLTSEIYDPLGERLAWSNSHYLNFAYAEINLDSKVIHRDNTMGKMMMLKEKYGDEVCIKDPSLLDMVLLSSYSDSLTVEQMMEEAGIEPAESYLRRTIEVRLEKGNTER
jgi:predicted amidohydrolase